MSKVAKYKAAAGAGLLERNQDELVRKQAPLVKRIAYHLIQSGMIGLLEASKNYDASQGASFETYAGIRIRGAMLDEIRKGDWAPRSLHRKVREISKAVAEIEAETGRDARDSEVAARMNMDLDSYYQTLQDATSHKVFSFEDLPSKDDVLSEGLYERGFRWP